ncbi:MAG: GMC family oxidoreductase N-terminal domain-containing protein [Actinomycetota bacterium]|nr:GMC family oxidoreductase N-terminal domain-containing protein [Actinomycetota bacterium]
MTRARRRATLAAICDTFAPGSGTHGAETVLEELAGEDVRRGDRLRAELALAVLSSRAATALARGGPRRFVDLRHDERERVLLHWADSRLGKRRALFHGLRKLALGAAYTGDSPARSLTGYPGPPGRIEAPAGPLSPLPIAGDLELSCDVVVVGSGAGGGPAAAALASAGLDVIVVEAGAYHQDGDFDGDELGSNRRLYRSAATVDLGIGIAAGRCVGGGTLLNYASSFRTPDDVRAEWAAAGAGTFGERRYDEALDDVWERIGVTEDESRPSTRDRLFRDGLAALGWHAGVVPRAVRGCEQGGRCGFCSFGCPYGAKQSTVHTWLVDATAAGARLLAGATVDRIAVERGAARGVVATRRPSGARVRVSSRAVVCAAGALETPPLLRRSGLGNEHVGRHLRLQPSTFVFGVFDGEVEPWGGTPQAVYSEEHADLDGSGHGVRYMTQPLHPGFLARFAPWRSARQHLAAMRALPRTNVITVQIRDRDGGEVKMGRSGTSIRYRVSKRDAAHVRAGIHGGARILHAAGAREVFTAHTVLCRTSGDPSELARQTDAAGYGSGECGYGTVHMMGTARMGAGADTAACDPEGRLYGVRGVVVCDGSALPSASRVNPMVTIEATSLVNARALAATLTRN